MGGCATAGSGECGMHTYIHTHIHTYIHTYFQVCVAAAVAAAWAGLRFDATVEGLSRWVEDDGAGGGGVEDSCAGEPLWPKATGKVGGLG